VFREVKVEKKTGVGFVGPTSKVNCWVGGEIGLVCDSGWSAAVGDFLRCAARCWKPAWMVDSGLAWKIEG